MSAERNQKSMRKRKPYKRKAGVTAQFYYGKQSVPAQSYGLIKMLQKASKMEAKK